MPKYAVQPQWRSRRAAIGKKGELDYELLMESEVEVIMPSKERVQMPSSPVSIASTLDVTVVPEMRPLPGAWVTVGKGGRPVKDNIMYDEPPKAKPKNKKKRRKAASSEDDSEGETLVTLGASSSKCLERLSRAQAAREKEVRKAKDAKHWLHYQQTKQLKLLARDTLVAALVEEGLLEGYEDARKPEPIKRRNEKGSSRAAKARRKARLAAVAARCYAVDVSEDELQVDAQAAHPRENAHPLEKRKSTDGWVRLRAAMAAAEASALMESAIPTEGESKVSSSDVEVPSATEQSAPNGKMKRERHSSKQCTIA